MSNPELIIVAASESVQYEKYSLMPLDRIELFSNLVQIRMIYYDGGFHSHLDLFNKILYGKYFFEASYPEKREMLNIWNLPTLNSVLAVNPLLNKGINCKIINNFDSEFDILCECCKGADKPLIGISTTFILQWSEVGRILKKIFREIPDARIILGGAFVNDSYVNNGDAAFERYMRKYNIRYVLYGYNSEFDLLNLYEALSEENKELSTVFNLVYVDDSDKFVVNNSKWHPPVLENPEIRWDKLGTMGRSHTAQIRTSSGCPFSCAFCNYSIMARDYSLAPIEKVKAQLDRISESGDIEALIFIDDNLNVPVKRFRELLQLLKDYDFRWYAFLRVQFIDESIAREMKSSGCDGVYLGLESGNDHVLKEMNKKATVENYLKGIKHLRDENITIFASFIIGFPGETNETVKETIDFIEKSGIDYYSLKEWYYLHTSSIHKKADEIKLEGEGNVWRHSTMTSTMASEKKLEMFTSIKDSVHIDPDMGMWYLSYLRDRGFSWNKIRASQKILNEMILLDNQGRYLDKEDLFGKLSKTILI